MLGMGASRQLSLAPHPALRPTPLLLRVSPPPAPRPPPLSHQLETQGYSHSGLGRCFCRWGRAGGQANSSLWAEQRSRQDPGKTRPTAQVLPDDVLTTLSRRALPAPVRRWRTALVVRELEQEIEALTRGRAHRSRLKVGVALVGVALAC